MPGTAPFRFPLPEAFPFVFWATRGRAASLALAALVAFSIPAPAAAQEATSAEQAAAEDAPAPEDPEDDIPTTAPEGVEVIRIKGKTVTAMETEVPSSVTQFDPATIAALGAQNIADLAKVTPNVEIRRQGATTATFFIRGVGLSDFNANAAGAVAIYQDDVAMNSPALQLGQLFDLADVNVLRGPQGSGAGRNASAGAIKISSRKPTNDFEAALRVDLGVSSEDTSPDGVFGLRDYEGALQIPLVEDVLSSRFAFRFTDNEPFRNNGCNTSDWPSQAERNADPVTWRGVDVCGIRTTASRLTDVEPVGKEEVNDTYNWAARGAFRFQPDEIESIDTRADFLLNFHGSRLDQLSTLGQSIGTRNFFGDITRNSQDPTNGGSYRDPDITEQLARLGQQGLSTEERQAAIGRDLARNLDKRPYRGDYNRVGKTKLDTWGTFLRGDFEIGSNVELTTITAYDWYDRSRETDSDFTPVVLFESLVDDDAWQVVQDIRLSGEIEERSFRWSVGGFALYEELNLKQTTFLIDASSNRPEYEQTTSSFGVFADFQLDFLEDFTLEIGGRYNWERKEFDFVLTQGTINPTFRFINDKRTWDAPTGTIALRYRFSPELQFYSKLSRGWKGGHFNGAATVTRAVEPADPETITATEAGFTARILDGRVSGRAAFFYYRYEDYQVFLFDESTTSFPNLIVINANDAETLGSEIELTVRPLEDLVPDMFDGLRLSTAISWLRSEFLDFTQVSRDSGGTTGQPTIEVRDYSGNPLINSPEWKVVLTGEWAFDFGRYGTVTPRYDGVWTDDVFFDPTEGRGRDRTLPEYAIGQRAHWIHNLRIGYQLPQGQLEVAAFVRNVTNEIVKTYAFDATLFSGSVVNFVGEPRSYGMSVSFKY